MIAMKRSTMAALGLLMVTGGLPACGLVGVCIGECPGDTDDPTEGNASQGTGDDQNTGPSGGLPDTDGSEPTEGPTAGGPTA